MVFDERIDDYVFAFNPSLKPKKDIRGLSSDMIVTNELSRKKRDSIRRQYMKTLNNIYIINIDSTTYDANFILTESKKEQQGLETYINIKGLTEGKHLLNVIRKRKQKKDTSQYYQARIPFWFYPN